MLTRIWEIMVPVSKPRNWFQSRIGSGFTVSTLRVWVHGGPAHSPPLEGSQFLDGRMRTHLYCQFDERTVGWKFLLLQFCSNQGKAKQKQKKCFQPEKKEMKRFLLSISQPSNHCPKTLCPHSTNNTLFPTIPFPLAPNSNHYSSLITCLRSVCFTFSLSPAMSNSTRAFSSSSSPSPPPPLSIQIQFEDFHKQLEDSGVIRERIQSVVREMEHAIRLMQSSIILIHQSLPASGKEKKSLKLGVP